MNQIGKKIYYNLATGNVLLETSEMQGDVITTTLAQDFQAYTALQGIEQSSVGVIQCDYGYQLSNFQKYPFHIDITKNPIDETAIVWDTNNPYGASLAEVQVSKIAQINDLYNQVTTGTFTSTAFDGTTMETYSCTPTDQARINGEVTMALTVKAGYSTEPISWRNVNQIACVEWTPDAMIKLGADLHKFVTTQTDYLEALTIYINSLTTIDEINEVTYGMTIPS